MILIVGIKSRMVLAQRERPLIAVVGSVDGTRAFNPPLRAVGQARAACRELGRELARAGCDIAVFSSKPTYIEHDVVHGYAEGTDTQNPGRVAAYPPRHREIAFALPEGSSVALDTYRDTSGEWEVSYYRTLLNCDGVLLVGGGQATRVAGIVAMAQGIPVLPVAAFGGGAGQVWVNLDKVRNHADDEDIALLGQDWSTDSAARLTASLMRQRTRRAEAARIQERADRSSARRTGGGLTVAVLCAVTALAALVLADGPGRADARALAALTAAPLLASVAGAIIRNSFETETGWVRAGIRGLGAGLVTVLLYFASQLLAVPALFDQLDVRRLLFFAIPLGFSAGFTFDLVYERLRAGAIATPPQMPELTAPGAAGPPTAPGTPPHSPPGTP
ncbi:MULTISPECIES: hypothetical protein [unclassified Streptomyces]|uniref:hypothetical protein n=1 Tax=unclassified Streptomyces TaxID=2593676 RepID=UPI002E29DC95|nr:hypothetical protein [Streptomyces sp. NBC_01439]